jgi:hypothetical protein
LRPNTENGNLWLSVAQHFGVSIDRFGVSTERSTSSRHEGTPDELAPARGRRRRRRASWLGGRGRKTTADAAAP